jgi:Ca2+-dependent lipid-binding protein
MADAKELRHWSREVDHILDVFGEAALSKPTGPPFKSEVPVAPTAWPSHLDTVQSIYGVQGAKMRVEQQRTAALVHNAAVSQLIASSLGPWQPKPVDYRPPPPPPPTLSPALAPEAKRIDPIDKCGMLRVMLKSASGLRAADLNGKSDPYVTLSLRGVQHKSRVVTRSLNPSWDEMFEFEGSLRDLTSEPLQVVVFDKDCITRDDALGSASVNLLDLRSVREKVVDAELSTKGRVLLVLTWTAHGDAPPVPDPALLRRGTIQVKLQGAAGLKAADLNGKSDPYAVLSLGGKQHKSKVVSKTLNPHWDETFTFEGTLGDLTSESLQVEIFDKDRITRDDSLGSASINLSDLWSVREKVVDAELSTKGRVSLVVTWTTHGDAPPPPDPALLRRGTIQVKLQGAAGLKAADLNGKSDLYAVLSLCGKQQKSKVVSKTLNPHWDETFTFEGTLGDLTSESLQVEIFDKDRITRDDSLGSATVNLTDLRSVREKAVDAELSTKGRVSLVLTWTAHGDAPPPPNPALLRRGTVQVKLLGAAGLKAADLNGKSDPYAVLSLLGKQHKSKVVSKMLNPRWDETFTFEGTLGELTSESLRVEIFDKDRITRDDSLGSATVSLSDLRSVRDKAVEADLSSQGRVSLVLTWTAHGDAPPPPDPALLRCGTIQVKLQGAAGLKATDLNGKSDPYAVLSLGGKQHKSKVVSKTLNPRWDECFTFEGTLGELTSESLQVEIFDKDRITRDDSLGSASINLSDLRSVREKAVEAELSTEGRVLLVVTWTSHGDAPPPPDPALLRRGTIQVKLQGAAGLKAADLNGKSDPYAVLSLCGKQQKSKVVSKTLNPHWDETFTFEGTLGDLTSESLQVEIFDKDRITRDDSLGSAAINLLELREVHEKDVEAELSVKGIVSLRLTWVPDKPTAASVVRAQSGTES